jgi:hypothetical protein
MRANQFLPLFAVAMCVSAPLSAIAQYENGSLLGTIRDATGAPIPGADILVVNADTGTTSRAKTDSEGNYDVPQLRVGVYNITATAPGFSKAVAEKITVSVGNRQRIDLSLTVGGTETTVQVTDVAIQPETESSQRDQTISNYQASALPLVNRNYSDFLGLVTGVRQAPTAATTSSNLNAMIRQGSYNVNDQRSVSNNSCSTAWTTTPTVNQTRASTIRSSLCRRILFHSSA